LDAGLIADLLNGVGHFVDRRRAEARFVEQLQSGRGIGIA
jgi:hypothetical protein